MGAGIVGLGRGQRPLAQPVDQDGPVAVRLDREALGQIQEGHLQARGDADPDRRLGLLGHLGPPSLGVEAAVEQAVRRGQDRVGGEAEPLGAAADGPEGGVPVGGAAPRAVEGGEDRRQLALGEIGGHRRLLSVGQGLLPCYGPEPGAAGAVRAQADAEPLRLRLRPRSPCA